MIAEEDVKGRGEQVQVLGARQVDQEAKHGQNVRPPEETKGSDIRLRTEPREPGTNPASNRCPGRSMAGRVLKALDQRQGDEYQQDQAKNNIGIPGAMQEAAQLPGAEKGAANREDDQSKQD